MRFCFMAQRWSPWLWAAIALLLLLFSVSNDSIDQLESQTWDYARLGTFREFCHELKTDDNSESRMPLGMFSAWAWSQAFGTREAAMRSINLVWAAIALASLAKVGRQIGIPWLPVLFAVQPFVWYSMDSARTPLMEMAGGSLLLAGTIACIQRKPVDSLASILLCVGAILLSGTTILGMIPLAAVAAALATQGLWNRLRWPRPGKYFLVITSAVIAMLGIYYVVTVLREGGGSQLWRVSPANLCYVVYEFLGFQGLGPGRQDLRSVMKGVAPVRGLLLFLPGLLLLLGAYLTLAATAFKSWLTREASPGRSAGTEEITAISGPAPLTVSVSLFRVWLLGIGVATLSSLLLFALAMFTGVPFWGLHLAGAFPFWIVALAVTIRWARQGLWRKSGRRAGLAVLALLLLSCLLIRLLPSHRHDNYRDAVAEAVNLSSRGQTVWWVADHSGGTYYGLPLGAPQKPGSGEVLFSMNRTAANAPLPNAIIISRPDTFDSMRAVSRLLESGMYSKKRTLQSFEIWQLQTP